MARPERLAGVLAQPQARQAALCQAQPQHRRRPAPLASLPANAQALAVGLLEVRACPIFPRPLGIP
jgi:hypothetical protein